MEQTHSLLNPFKYFIWKAEMMIHIRSKDLYRVTMGTEVKPNSIVEKLKLFSRIDEAFGILCLIISRDLLFHVDILSNPDELWLNI